MTDGPGDEQQLSAFFTLGEDVTVHASVVPGSSELLLYVEHPGQAARYLDQRLTEDGRLVLTYQLEEPVGGAAESTPLVVNLGSSRG